MRKKLETYVELLFAGNPEAEEIRQEILLNTLDHYDDLIAQGKTPEAAYSLAIAGIGDVSELLDGTAPAAAPAAATEKKEKKPANKLWSAIAVALFIISPVPVVIFQNEIGVCLLLMLVAAGTALLILAGREEKKEKQEKTPREKKQEAVNGIVWLSGLAVYLVLSTVTHAWGVTWLIFPILAAVSGILNAVSDLKEAENHEN